MGSDPRDFVQALFRRTLGDFPGTYLEEHLEQAQYTIVVPLCVLLLALSQQLLVRIILATRSGEMLAPASSAYPTGPLP
jgi:hypothetical protein